LRSSFSQSSAQLSAPTGSLFGRLSERGILMNSAYDSVNSSRSLCWSAGRHRRRRQLSPTILEWPREADRSRELSEVSRLVLYLARALANGSRRWLSWNLERQTKAEQPTLDSPSLLPAGGAASLTCSLHVYLVGRAERMEE